MGAHPAPFTQAARRVRERRAFFRDERQAVTADNRLILRRLSLASMPLLFAPALAAA